MGYLSSFQFLKRVFGEKKNSGEERESGEERGSWKKRSFGDRGGFTLTELIAVITILSILSVIGFVVMSHQSSVARDGKRISDIKTLSESARITSAQLRKLPTPIADSVSLTVSGTFIGYQGFMSTSIVNPLGYGSDKIYDPLDGTPYTYRVNQHYDQAQFLAYLENPRFERTIEIAGRGRIQEIASQSLTSALPSNLPSLFSQAYTLDTAYALDSSTTDLSSRYPYSAGDRLGIFLSKGSRQPLQNGVSGTGSRDISLSDASTLDIIVGSQGADEYVSTDISTGSLNALKSGTFDEKALLGMNSGTGNSGDGGDSGGGGGGLPVSHILTMGEYSVMGNTYYGYIGSLTISLYATYGVTITTITPGSLIDDTVDGYVIDSLFWNSDYSSSITILAGSTDMPSNVAFETPYANLNCTNSSVIDSLTMYSCTGSTVSTDFYVGSQHDLGITVGEAPVVSPTLLNPSNVSNAPLNTDIISNIVTASHISSPIPLTVSGAEFRVNGGSWVTSANISDGDQVEYKTFVTQENEEKRITINFNNIQSEWIVLARGSCFSIDNNGVLASYNAACGSIVTIPESVDSVAVTGIGSHAFAGKGLTSVTFPTNISIEVQNYAFEWNSLTSITIPDNIWFRQYQIPQFANGISQAELWGGIGWGNGAFGYNLIPNVGAITMECPAYQLIGLFRYNGSSHQTHINPCADPSISSPNNITNASLNTDIISNIVTAMNISNSVPITVSGAEFRVNGGSWITSGNISNGDQVEYKTVVTQDGERKVVQINFNGNISEWTVDAYSCFTFSSGMITGYNEIACGLDVTIPSKIRGMDVTIIGNQSFTNRQITSVNIPNSVHTIQYRAFANNQLTSIIIPTSVTNIQQQAFENNQLSSLVIPNSVTDIQNSAFWHNQLTSITIGNGLTEIGDYSFAFNQLTSVTIPTNITSIGWSAFDHNQLTSITIPGNVTTIHDYAFDNNNISSLTLENGITTIRAGAFANNHITSLVIPNSVTNIFGYSYNGGYQKGAFENNHISSLILGNGLTEIGGYAFKDNQITAVTISSGVINIGYHAFANNRLTSISIPDSTVSIGHSAFYNNYLTSVSIGNGVRSIPDGAFAYNFLPNRYAINIKCPSNPEPLPFASYPFAHNGPNQTLDLSPEISGKCTDSFFIFYQPENRIMEYLNEGPKDVIIPSTISGIPVYKIEGFFNKQLTSIVIGSGITTIGGGAFQNNELTSVIIPNSVQYINGSAFENNRLTSITIPNSIIALGTSVFANQTNSSGNGTVYGPASGYVKDAYINNVYGRFDKVKLPNYVDQ